ncbi:Pancreatic alpha-amylase [Holothuria leucospilota]|uniref:alpha-amylase n=1 Tax=Holothuria leucospilota TaxID=206669 RepID=A0A9Q1BK83_HOLLE|nr:Pancreatic alpha-amylase [Holothuria leucospilota]
MNRLIEIGVAGFRVDACKHMWPEDVQVILDGLDTLNTEYFPNNSQPFIFQEVINRNEGIERITASEYTPFGMVTEFKYGAHLTSGILKENPLKWFQTFGEAWGLLPSDLALVFVDNHDNQRGHGGTGVVTFKDPRSYKMATVFMLAYPYGTVRVMSSYEFHQDSNLGPPSDVSDVPLSPNLSVDGLCIGPWICEHRWKQIRNMIGFHNAVRDEPLTNWWDDGGYQIAFGRGKKAFIVINNGESILFETLQTGLPAGEYCDILSGDFIDESCSGRIITVDESGLATFMLAPSSETPMSAIYLHVKLDRRKMTCFSASQSQLMLIGSSHVITRYSFVQ